MPKTRHPNQQAKAVVARRLGCRPGGAAEVACAYCPAGGRLRWFWSDHPNTKCGQVHVSGLTWDHVVPVSRGGQPHDPDNLTLACPACNSSKNGRPLDEWRVA